MSNQQSFEEQGLVLGDRINYPYLLAMAIQTFLQSIVKAEGFQSEQEVREASVTFFNMIPTRWRDEQFNTDTKDAVVKTKVDDRKEWCGKKIGKPKLRDEEVVEPYKLFHACIDLVNRRRMLSKTIFTEKMIPEPEDFEEK